MIDCRTGNLVPRGWLAPAMIILAFRREGSLSRLPYQVEVSSIELGNALKSLPVEYGNDPVAPGQYIFLAKLL